MRKLISVVGYLLALSAAVWVTCCSEPSSPKPRVENTPSTQPDTAPPQWVDQVKPFALGEPDAVLLFTTAINGNFEPCNCPGGMRGGLSRLSSLAQAYRARFERVRLIDAGNAFRNGMPGEPTNPHILRAFKQIGYDAMTLGVHEWALPAGQLSRTLGAGELDCLTSLVIAPSHPPAGARPWIAADSGPVKWAVISALSDEAVTKHHGQAAQPLRGAKPAAVKAQLSRLKRDGRFIVLLADALPDDTDDLPVDFWLHTHTEDSSTALYDSQGIATADHGRRSAVAAVALRRDTTGQVKIEYRLEWLDQRWPRDPRLLKTYHQYTQAAWQHYIKQERKPGPIYVPSIRCFECHKQAYQAWVKTKHARAHGSLVKAQRDGDANCLICHTTGFGTRHGFFSVKRTPALAGIHCQTCHDVDAAAHREKPGKLPKVKVETCRTCHTPHTDPHWNTEKRFAAIRCPGH